MPQERLRFPGSVLSTCLGVTLSAREVGYALMAGDNLYAHGVLSLRKIPSHEGRERRFRQAIGKLLDHGEPSHVVLVRFRVPGPEAEALLAIEHDALTREATARGATLVELSADQVRERLLPQGQRRSTRALADFLTKRFPCLWRGTLAATPLPYDARWAPATRLRTSREAYWRGMYLAAGACLLTLGEPAA